jgi:calcineurin-like phosphoesterase family protein
MSWFFTADTHFGHGNIIKYCKRPFLNKEELDFCDLIKRGIVPHTELKISKETIELMDETIIQNINYSVGKDDNLVIIGDFCHNGKKEKIKEYRNHIKCKNVYLILGNHDDRKNSIDVFKSVYENYLFNIDGQSIFTSHYPARSWDKASKGSWMLYGHVHNAYYEEDNGRISSYHSRIFNDGFASVLERHGIKNKLIINDLLAVCASVNGIDLTLDVGVDNIREGVGFGTPWSMKDIRDYMANKMTMWLARKTMSKLI